jgi:hypothetical protein
MDIQNQMDQLIASALHDHLSEVRQLLSSNGVSGADKMSDRQVRIAFLKAIKDSTSFRDSASRFLSSLVQTNFAGSKSLNFQDDFNIDDPADPVPGDSNPIVVTPPKTTTTSTSTPTASGSTSASFWQTLGNQQNLNKLIGTGLDTMSTVLKNKANQQSEQNALELERLRLEQVYAQQQVNNGSSILPDSGLSTGAVIGISLGAALLIGVVIYFAVRKK